MVNTEADIQDRLFREFERRRHVLIVPNVTMFGWESDLVSVTPAGFICEYEIKCSRADFKIDAKKFRHNYLTGADTNGKMLVGPAYFYYVVPRDLVHVDEVPQYAGLIYSHPVMQVVKTAPRLHRVKATESQRTWLVRGLAFRYWRYRLRVKTGGASQ